MLAGPAVTLRCHGIFQAAEALAPPASQVYRPLEFLFSVAALTTLAENFLPQLISLPKVRHAPLHSAPLPLRSVGFSPTLANTMFAATVKAPCKRMQQEGLLPCRQWCRIWCGRRCR